MLDSVATGYLDLPVTSDARATLVEPGVACSAAKGIELELSGLEQTDGEFAVLAVERSVDGGFQGSFAEINDANEDDVKLRMGGCSPGEYSVNTQTITGSGGSCQTRTVLRECRHVHGYGYDYGNMLDVTYDSGWLDCSDPCLAA